jgi:predicted hydrocarbon binding protein
MIRKRVLLFNPLPSYQEAEKPVSTYEESLMERVIIKKKPASDLFPHYALDACSVISSMSGSMEEIRYRFGVYLGRTLYKRYYTIKNYILADETITDLVSFLEAAGYKHLTYSASSEKPEVRIYQPGAPDLGKKIHTFEAGIMSGFLSAVTNRHAPVRELECSSNGGECCRFAYDFEPSNTGSEVDTEALDRFCDSVAAHFSKKQQVSYGTELVPGEYLALSWAMLLDKSYNEEIKGIVYHIGARIGAKLFKAPARKKNPMPTYLKAMKVGRFLGFGRPEITSSDPLRAKLSFEIHFSRSEFVGVALSFYSGILSKLGTGELSASQRKRGSGYVAEIRQQR